MVFRITLDNKKIELPNKLNLEERISLCNKIVEENMEYFIYEIPSGKYSKNSACEKVKNRLCVLGNYIYLSPENQKRSKVITQYKNTTIRKSEVLFSTIENNHYVQFRD